MTKQEIIEAINATIVPNDKKAITAESLANLLTEMVEAMGEGAEQIVFYLGVPDEQSVVGEYSMFYLTPEEKEHNANMFKKIKESTISLPCFFDATKVTAEEFGNIEGLKYSLASVYYYMIPKEAQQNEPEEDMEGAPEFLLNKDVMIALSYSGTVYILEDGNILTNV